MIKIKNLSKQYNDQYVLKNLSLEIKREFPLTKGFSVSNLKNMARFYREYSDFEIGQSVTVQITWTHNIEVLRVESKELKGMRFYKGD